MRDLLRSLAEDRVAEAREIHVPLKELPPSLRAALKDVGYGSRDVAVVPQERVEPNPYAGEGQQGFVIVLDIGTGKRRDLKGGWGGARPDDPREIDFARQPVPIPEGGAIIVGTKGWPQTMATIYVHPSTIAAMLPPAAEVTDREQMILRTIRSLTSAGRKEVFAGEKVRPEEIDALVARGLLSKTKAGAVSITTAGKNVAEDQMGTMDDVFAGLCEESMLAARIDAMTESEVTAFAAEIDERISPENREHKQWYKAGEKMSAPYTAAAKKINLDQVRKYSTKQLMDMVRAGKSGAGKRGISSHETTREVALRVLRQRLSRGKKGIRKQSMF